MGHYCQRFHDAMLLYIPLGTPTIQTLCILRSGLPPEIMQFTPLTTPEMTLDEMMEAVIGAEILANWVRAVPEVPTPMFEDDHPVVPMDDAGMGEPVFHGGPFMLEREERGLRLGERKSSTERKRTEEKKNVHEDKMGNSN